MLSKKSNRFHFAPRKFNEMCPLIVRGKASRLISEFSILGKQMNNELIVRSQDLTKTSIKKFAPKGTKKRKNQ